MKVYLKQQQDMITKKYTGHLFQTIAAPNFILVRAEWYILELVIDNHKKTHVAS